MMILMMGLCVAAILSVVVWIFKNLQNGLLEI